MAKTKTVYICEECGASSPKWQGQCPQCKAWNSLTETVVSKPSKGETRQRASLYGQQKAAMVSAQEMLEKKTDSTERLQSGLYEIDRVFGGGAVFGSVSLVGGQPGIGKSTILTQLAINILINNNKSTVIYVAGEESPEQITQRIKRMTPDSAKSKMDFNNLLLVSSTNVDEVVSLVEKQQPQVLIVDSVQTMYTTDLTGIAGSVGQIKESASRLVAVAKRNNIPTFLVGHVTKEGDIAGPKVLEHIVDTVVEINGDRTGEVRLVRSLKNRFGPTDEVGLLRLTSDGLEEIGNPADIFLEEKTLGAPGSALALTLEGTRPMVVEVQALVVKSYLPNPRRVARGVNVSKLHLLLAVLQKHAKIRLDQHDVFVNVVGEMNFKDPALDLALAAALISAHQEKSLGKNVVYCGEIGLLGEVRSVRALKKRVSEAKRLGYKKVVTVNSISRVGDL